METITLFLNTDGGPIWMFDEEKQTYISTIPEKHLSNRELVESNNYIREKYRGLFTEKRGRLCYVGFKTIEENKGFLQELKDFATLVKEVFGEEYRVVDELDYEKFSENAFFKKDLLEKREKAERSFFLKEKKKAEKGDVVAMTNLYSCYFFGQGTEQDKEEALKWLKKAAKKNNPWALLELGLLHIKGELVRKNRPLGFSYIAKSADIGEERAIEIMGDCLYYGDEIKRDKEEAMEWYKKGMEHYYGYCTYAYARGYEEGAYGKPDYLKAMEYYFKAATFQRRGLFEIGRLYEKGWGVKKDYGRAFFFYDLSRKCDDPAGFYGVGHAYMEGIGVEKDYEKGIKELDYSAYRGYYRASYFLGIYYKLGIGVEQSDEKAFSYFKMAHDHGSWGGDLELGLCYEEGRGTSKNLFKAFSLVKASADIDFAPAYLELGRYYHEGIGTDKNDDKALEFLEKAVAKNVKGSHEYLASFFKEKGEEEKASSIMAQKAIDEEKKEYVGEHYRHNDLRQVYNFYINNLCNYLPAFMDSFVNIDPQFDILFLAVVSFSVPEKVGDSFIWGTYKGTELGEIYEDFEDLKEIIADYREILEWKEYPPLYFYEYPVEKGNTFKSLALAFAENLYQLADDDYVDEDEPNAEIHDYLDLLSTGLAYMSEDLRKMYNDAPEDDD